MVVTSITGANGTIIIVLATNGDDGKIIERTNFHWSNPSFDNKALPLFQVMLKCGDCVGGFNDRCVDFVDPLKTVVEV